jgi:hypothetical protein
VDKQLLQATGQSVDQLIGQNPIASPGEEGVTTAPYEDDTFIGQTVTFDAVPIPQFSSGEGSDTLQIVREGDQFKVTGVMDLSSASGSTGDPQIDAIVQEALKSAEIRITMTFPGEVVSSNGTIDGNSVTWEPKIGERTEIQAVAKATGGSSFPWLWIVIAAVVVVVVIVVVVALSARGKKGEAAPEVEAGAEVTAPATPAAETAPAVEPTPPPVAPMVEPTPPPAPPAVETTPPPAPPVPPGDESEPPPAPPA